ncbi:cleavage and polyadenylation specificity factor subunit 6 isoform X2 [Tachysurus fulvidraco]|uniref:cleavage and polyadenylation specificity factor subunit 6 isoform X2 n=1 Tax=Tachysurus fulvidraco TaxID=1234273 RepID=UPI001FEF4DFB|nr:cleavage and polyadenylation specificity factor subunit 6 isoform X2 [Tachysurus fulvidraco]
MAAMKADGGPTENIDIYADLNTEEAGDLLEAEADALYDDVLTGSVDSESTPGKQECKEDGMLVEECNGGKRFSVYIGNFNWWTSDGDLIAMARKQGVTDIVEVKFAENRTNGQSKGYAELVVSTEESLKRLLESMPQCKINGEKVECRHVSRRNLADFEAQSRRRIPLRLAPKGDLERSEARSSSTPSPSDLQSLPLPLMFPPTKPPPLIPSFYNTPPPPLPPPPLPLFNTPPPLFHPPLPYTRIPNAHNLNTYNLNAHVPNAHISNAHVPNAHISNAHVPNAHISNAHVPNAHISNAHVPNAHISNAHVPNAHILSAHTHNSHTSSLHINPAFFPVSPATCSSNNSSNNNSSSDNNSRTRTAFSRPRNAVFEELINRNRTIASSAITKAISAATSGDIRMAIETLYTATAVIKQSRVSNDKRCRMLVNSLNDCLNSIETKCFPSKRHRSQERASSRSRERYRERSSSTDRERDRERERERGHDREHRDRH